MDRPETLYSAALFLHVVAAAAAGVVASVPAWLRAAPVTKEESWV